MIRRCLCRHPGGKGNKHQWINSHLPRTQRYVEPYAGAATVLLHREPSPSEYLIEIDLDQVALLTAVRDRPRGLVQLLRQVVPGRESFNEARRRLEAGDYSDDVERASCLYIVRQLAYNGERRQYADRPGRDAVAYWQGRFPWLAEWSRRLRRVQIIGGKALDWFEALDGPDTLWYLDPPYMCRYRHYGDYSMGFIAHRDLLRAVLTLRGKVAISGIDHPLYRRFLCGWCLETRDYPVHANWSTDPKPTQTECLWCNF